jgi:hypothetical protein
MGRATVREHFPTQEISWTVTILFIFSYLISKNYSSSKAPV